MKSLCACFFTSSVFNSHSHSHWNHNHSHSHSQSQIMAGSISGPSGGNAANILLNHDFSGGLDSWHVNCCDGYVVSAEEVSQLGISMETDGNCAVITSRKECWQGLEQDITSRVSIGSTYIVSALVGISGLSQGSNDVQATLKLEYHDSATSYLFIGRTSVTRGNWKKLEGTFSLSTMPKRVVFYLEGPAPGVDILIRPVEIGCSNPNNNIARTGCVSTGEDNIVINPQFDDGLNNWSGRGCKIALHDSMGDGKILPKSGKFFASATERTQSWNGIQQDITGRVQRKLAYEVTTSVRIFGNNVTTADVRATLYVQTSDLRDQYIGIANVQATDKDWIDMQGKFLLNGSPSKVVIYLEGPPPGTDILVNSLVVKRAPKTPPSTPPDIKGVAFGVNVIENSNLADGTNGWYPLGNCTLSVKTGSPHIMPPMARDSLGPHELLSGRYILVTNRTQTWMGPAQTITDKLKLFIRKRDVTLKFSGLDASNYSKTSVQVRQIQNNFPVGTCISRMNIDNEDFVDFFVKHFNWAVFGNELKWYWTEPQQGNFNYKDADDLLNLCQKNKIETRGHCIFWEVDGTVQQWIKALNKTDLMAAVQNRLNGLLTRYKGKFNHYDVNNEMLHGSFYQDRLGKDIRANMFKTANQLDPAATLFVNDYHVEDGCDTRSCPEKYIEHILDLQEQGSPVGGIGIQGHIDSPVGPIVCSSLDKLGILGLPIWFTELDVSSTNEYVRADDLEVMLREAMAHPAVEGLMLWGFWELFMSRDNSHLVNAEGEINEAGKRFLALKQEWLSHSHGNVDQQGQYNFRGFHGTYKVDIVIDTKKVSKTFVLDKGDSPMVVSIDF
ncbi:hypothetical protein Ahy_A06g030778 isoform B [Arachis hypogaea]|uniref:GH10 domain-containing protein n=1 Tax=Arachis hypogaea TaxID=3818 RepID=A0A445CX88_ARAHY|nr:hypothetical protein Ahy_A06g030778 isoform B [Arachis hypogaea]